MSYSFSVKAATKALALAAAMAKFDSEVLPTQKLHQIDRAAAQSNLETQLALVDEAKDGEEVTVSMNGSLGGTDINWSEGTAGRLTSASSGCNVYLYRAPA